MNTTLYILAMIPLCAMLNRLRGTYSWCAHLDGVCLAFALALHTLNPWMLLAYPLFLLGECFGWGTLIGTMLNKSADRFARETSRMTLSVRGAWWWAGVCVLIAFNGASLPLMAASIYALSISFPMSVELASEINVKDKWALAEWMYGAVQGLVIGILSV